MDLLVPIGIMAWTLAIVIALQCVRVGGRG